MANLELSNKELKMTSVELVEKINEYRKEENKLNGKKYIELKHKSFMTKIRTELEVLESLGLSNQQNILLVDYLDKKGEVRPCYQLNRDGIIQMSASESAIVRAKIVQYINELEDENKQLEEIAISEETKDKRWYKVQYTKTYDINKIRRRIRATSFDDIDKFYNGFLETTKVLKTDTDTVISSLKIMIDEMQNRIKTVNIIDENIEDYHIVKVKNIIIKMFRELLEKSNRSNGGDKSAQTKTIKAQAKEIEELKSMLREVGIEV